MRSGVRRLGARRPAMQCRRSGPSYFDSDGASPASATAAAAAANESRAAQAAGRTRTNSNQKKQWARQNHGHGSEACLGFTLKESWRGYTAEAI